jgi:outer membrane immunogenic protein
MRKMLLATVALMAVPAFQQAAVAADMPIKAPAYVYHSWTGIYGDVDVGWMHDSENANWVNSAAPNSFKQSGSEGAFGGHVGIQYQFGQIVLGVEGGIMSPFSQVAHTGGPQAGCPNPAFTCQTGMQRFWTAGPRLGFVFNRDWLIYGTGGYARATTQVNSFTTATGVQADGGNVTAGGWFAGAGIDYLINSTKLFDVLVGVQYEHVQVGSSTFLSAIDAGSPAGVNRRDISSVQADVVSAKLTVKINPWY